MCAGTGSLGPPWPHLQERESGGKSCQWNNNIHSDLRKKRDIYEFSLASRGKLAYGHDDDFDYHL